MTRDSVSLPTILDELDVGIFLHDPETGVVLDANSTAEEVYGYPEADSPTLAIEEFSANSSEFTQETAVEYIQAAADGESQEFEWYARRNDGELIWVQVKLQPVTIDATSCVMATARNISDSKERMRRLRLLYRVLRHNLRNEMNVILGYANNLKRALQQDSLKRQAEIINETANDVASLSDSISELERITEYDPAGRSRTELTAFVERLVADFNAEYDGASVSVDESTTSPDAEVWVDADDGLRLALERLLKNALEHSDRDQPDVLLSVHRVPSENQVRIDVGDDGPGIPPVNIDVLDDDNEITDLEHGSGLGLWVVKWCIESLGGEVTFSENDPRGTVVSLCLPAKAPPDDE